MVYSKKYNYYKFPGGGIETDECMEDALIREVLEETGLCVIRDSIQEYGQILRIQKGTKEDIFIQDNYYFLCSVKKDIEQQNLDKYEADEGFTLEFLKPQLAIDVNRETILDDFTQIMLEREALVLELLIQDLKWGFQYFPYYQVRVECERFHGWAALNDLTDGEYIYWDFFEKAGKVPVAGKGMCWLTLIPDGKKHSMTAMFMENGNVSAWYIDVIHSVMIDEDGVLAFMDKYLDVMLTTSGDILVDDKEELDAAYRSGEFTEEQYEEALLEGQRIIDEWGKDIHATELICKEMLNYVKAQVNNQPLTVFLDIDGVLNIYQPDLEVQTLLSCAGENICELIYRMKAKVVVISSHRLGGINWDILLDFFKSNKIYDVDITPYGEEYHSRTEEINAYLHMHPNIERYVILDDCFQDDYSCDLKLREHLVFIDALKGLQKQDIIKACEILNRQTQAPNYM